MKFNIVDESYTYNLDEPDRKIVTSSSAFGILREQLVKNIGLERMKGFLFRYGWEMGVKDAKQAMKTESSLDILIKSGPILHMESGHIRGIKHDCSVEKDANQKIVSVLGKGTWIDSYEALEHIKRLGLSKTPVCHILSGYASGYMTTIFGEPLLAKEITCVGKGDSECTWIVKTQKEWGIENTGGQIFAETPIVKELEYTYEQLLEQQKFITQLSSFQKKLTEEISNGSNLQTIARIVYNTIQIPILIEDIDGRTITYSGLSEEKYLELEADMKGYFIENGTKNFLERKEKSLFPFRKKELNTTKQKRLITPILVQKEIYGYCSFIYEGIKNDQPEEDYLFLDRFANAASLILLNEKARFESFERMKGNFLDQILHAQLPAGEIIKRGKYAGLDLGQPYYVIVMNYRKTERSRLSIEEEFYLQEQILESIFRYFNEENLNILVGQREGKLIFLMMKSDKCSPINKIMKEFHLYLVEKFPRGEFSLGISNEGEDIENAARHYEEAAIAVRLSLRKKIVEFHSLGIVGVLINPKNMIGIKMIAEEELGSLYNMKDQKAIELLKTLYIYLSNGGKLEQTMADLSLSMSGLRHRIKRIESLLDKDLRDPKETHQLLLIIKSLIALGELDID